MSDWRVAVLRCCTAFVAGLLACLFWPGEAGAQTTEKPNLTRQPTLYVVGYAHLDTEWRWEYPQVINEYIRKTMEDNFKLLDKYPHYVFNFSGANRYRFMKEYFPADFAKLKSYVDSGRWFPTGSSMEEGDVNAPSAEAIIRQVLYGNNWFRKELGKASAEYMLPDCFGFPASLPTILAHSGVLGFSTQKLVWGSSAAAGGPESLEKTPEGTPFNVGVWVGPDGESVLAGLNPGDYSGGIDTDLSKPLAPAPPDAALEETQKKLQPLRQKLQQQEQSGQPLDPKDIQEFITLQNQHKGLAKAEQDRQQDRYQGDWAARVEQNGKVSGVYTDYHYYGTGDIGGSPDEESVKRLEAIVTKGTASLPPPGEFFVSGQPHPEWPPMKVGDGPVHVISANADQMFLDITPAESAGLPRYTGEMELTNHSAGSLTSQAYQKRWIRKEELLADAAEKASIAAEWLGARPYPIERLNDAWTLAMGGHFHAAPITSRRCDISPSGTTTANHGVSCSVILPRHSSVTVPAPFSTTSFSSPLNVIGYQSFDLYKALSEPSGDPADAKAQLKLCGHPTGFSTNIAYRSDRPQEVLAAQALQQALSQVGIKAQLQGYLSGKYYTNFAGSTAFVHSHDLGIDFGGWGADWPDGYGFLDEIANGNAIVTSGGNTNIEELNDPVVNADFAKAANLLNAAQRNAVWTQIDHQIMSDAAILPEVYAKSLLYRNPNVTNVYVDPAY